MWINSTTQLIRKNSTSKTQAPSPLPNVTLQIQTPSPLPIEALQMDSKFKFYEYLWNSFFNTYVNFVLQRGMAYYNTWLQALIYTKLIPSAKKL